MVSSLRPQEYKKMDEGCHGNVVQRDAAPRIRYNQSKVDRLKFALVVLNTFLFVLGGIALGLSVYGLVRYEILGYKELFQSVTLATIIPWICAVSSTLAVTMVPLCGCHGAVAQRRNELILFFLYLLVMLLLDLVICIWIVTTADKIQDGIEASVRQAVQDYHDNPITRRAIDDLQKNLGCCGSDEGLMDYGLRGAPPSCTHEYLFTPCNMKMLQLYDKYRYIAIGGFAALAALLMLALILIISLLGAFKRRCPPRPPAPDRPRPEITVVDATNSVPSKQSRGTKGLGSQNGVVNIANNHNESSVV